MTNRLQDCTIERLACEHGRTHIANGFDNDEIRLTVPNGTEYQIGLDGIEHEIGRNFSIRWDATC